MSHVPSPSCEIAQPGWHSTPTSQPPPPSQPHAWSMHAASHALFVSIDAVQFSAHAPAVPLGTSVQPKVKPAP